MLTVIQALINVSTGAIHDFEISGSRPNYSVSKNAAAILLQQIAKDVSSSKMQIVSFHPGAIYTDAAKRAGWPADYDWDNGMIFFAASRLSSVADVVNKHQEC